MIARLNLIAALAARRSMTSPLFPCIHSASPQNHAGGIQSSDVDCAAVRVASHHVRRNGLAGHVRPVCAPGYRSRALRRSDYDLIFGNILARPLALMARDLGRAIAPGGVAVLAGLLSRQEALVVAAHRAQGLALERRLVIEGWSTLILRSGQRSDQTGGPGNQR